jgi:CDP-glucose 4,6-dehydratase
VEGLAMTERGVTPDPWFWKDRRVFVTGHTGFKGSWLCEWLLDMGAVVSGYSLAPETTPALFDMLGLAERVHAHTVGDVRDAGSLSAAMQSARPEVVLHLAAQPLVRRSYREPVETYATNVMGTVHLFAGAQQCPTVRSIVIVTSDKCYENRNWVWGYREDEAMGGHDPYSNSKGCAELITSAWRRSFFPVEAWEKHRVSVSSARAGNVIGGGDWSEDRLIPDAVRAWHQGGAVEIRSPNSVRPWQHVLEPLCGYLVLAERGYSSASVARGFNFGPADSDVQTVAQVLQQLSAYWPGNAVVDDISGQKEQPHEAELLKLDSSLAARVLGVRPRLSLDECMQMTAEWYASWHGGASGHELAGLTRGQIEFFRS